MKVLISFKFLLLFLFCSFTFPDTDDYCPPVEEASASSMIKICNFDAFVNSPGMCSSTTIDLEVGANCIGQTGATVRAVNIVSFPQMSVEYDLPAGVDDIYYKYTPQGGTSTIIGPINKFTFNGEYEQVSGTLLPIFEYSAKMFLDVSEQCETNSSGVASVALEIRLEDVNGQLYPAGNYADVGEIFYCEVFEETCNDCNTPPAGCNGGSSPIYYAQACGSCSSTGGNCQSEAGPKSSESKEGEVLSDFPLTVQPNPFKDFVLLTYTSKISETGSLEIIDAKGSVVFTEAINAEVGENRLRVNTTDFSDGIYFCRLNISGEVFTEKLVKSN